MILVVFVAEQGNLEVVVEPKETSVFGRSSVEDGEQNAQYVLLARLILDRGGFGSRQAAAFAWNSTSSRTRLQWLGDGPSANGGNKKCNAVDARFLPVDRVSGVDNKFDRDHSHFSSETLSAFLS